MKKFASFALVAAIAAGAAVGFAGCDNGKEEVTAESLLTSLGSYTAETDGIGLAVEGTLSSKAETVELTGEGLASVSEEAPGVDLFLTYGSDEASKGYAIVFERGEKVYTATGGYAALEGVSPGEYQKVLARYADAEGSLSFESSAPSADGDVGTLPGLPSSGVTDGLLSGLGVTMRETADGYELNFSLDRAVKTLAQKVSALLEGISPATTLNGLLENDTLEELVGMFAGDVKAADVLAFSSVNLPAARENETVLAYLKRIAADESLLGGQSPAGQSCLGDFTLEELIPLLTEGGMTAADVLESGKTYAATLAKDNGLAELLFGSGAKLDVTAALRFDKKGTPQEIVCALTFGCNEEKSVKGYTSADIALTATYRTRGTLQTLSDYYTTQWDPDAMEYARVKIG